MARNPRLIGAEMFRARMLPAASTRLDLAALELSTIFPRGNERGRLDTLRNEEEIRRPVRERLEVDDGRRDAGSAPISTRML